MPDLVLLWLADLGELVVDELYAHSLATWVLCLAPIVIFLEIPRFYLPLLGVALADRLGWGRQDPRAGEGLLAQEPMVSIMIAGRNEAATIEAAICSLLEQDYPNFEIIVIDDASEDEMYRVARKYARRGLIRLIRNESGRGRLGKPSAVNLGERVANGEFIISLDADTTFDRRMIQSLLAPFADPRVGLVAGNVHVRNAHQTLVTRIQTIEYAISIDLRKRWSSMFGCTLQGSGAISAFRRSALREAAGWQPELAEDTDVSLRMVKAGYKIAFAPDAVAMTEVPTRLSDLARQRTRWDRGGLRTFFLKHARLMRPSVSGWSFATELWSEFLFAVLATLAYPFYFLGLLWSSPGALLVVSLVMAVLYVALSFYTLAVVGFLTKRIEQPWRLLGAALATPFFKEYLRWVRFKALVYEILRVRYEDSFLPSSAWMHAPRY